MMTLKAMTIEQYKKAIKKRVDYRWGEKQALVKEFLESGAEACEITDTRQTAKSLQAGLLGAIKRMNADAKCVIRKDRVFIVRKTALDD